MHVQQETWFGDAADDRDDPTLIWTRSQAPLEPCETAPPTASSNVPIVLASVIVAIGALAAFGAAILMRVLVVTAPEPQADAPAEVSDMRAHTALAAEPAPAPVPPRLPSESAAIAIVTSETPPPAPAIVDEPAREVEPARRSIARAHSRRAHANKATDAGAPGTLRINSLPWAEVYLDGAHVGPTPQASLSMKPGRHRVKLVNEQMALRKTFDVYIRPGQVVTRSENLSL